jgi:hypothetical protein
MTSLYHTGYKRGGGRNIFLRKDKLQNDINYKLQMLQKYKM